jgi:NADH dehydrogenase (ubiquinone) Fe-S protein 5
MACYVVNTTGDDNKGAEKCMIPLADYLECLHHRREVCGGAVHMCPGSLADAQSSQGERVQLIQAAYRKWEAENADFVAKNAKDVRSLGVIEATMEEKNLRVPKWLPHVKRN